MSQRLLPKGIFLLHNSEIHFRETSLFANNLLTTIQKLLQGVSRAVLPFSSPYCKQAYRDTRHNTPIPRFIPVTVGKISKAPQNDRVD